MQSVCFSHESLPLSNKHPREYNPMWYTEATSFVRADAATCRETAVFTLPGW